jgi:hypothetical protein
VTWDILGLEIAVDCFKGRKVSLSHALAEQNIGATQVGDRPWLVSFMQYDLG